MDDCTLYLSNRPSLIATPSRVARGIAAAASLFAPDLNT